jgi:hypothetical protein
MSTTKPTSHGHGHSIEEPEPGLNYETRDARVRPLIWGGVATFILLIASFLIIAGLLFVLGSNPRQTGNTLPENFQPRLPTSGPILEQDGDRAGDLYIAEETRRVWLGQSPSRDGSYPDRTGNGTYRRTGRRARF